MSIYSMNEPRIYETESAESLRIREKERIAYFRKAEQMRIQRENESSDQKNRRLEKTVMLLRDEVDKFRTLYYGEVNRRLQYSEPLQAHGL